ncbi:MAG: Histidine--tRNA ligase [Verrucomicrobiota bacterium]|jgi:histidyl-tRNA synthetase
MSDIRTLPGFREFYPEDRAVLGHIFDVWRQACRRYGFREWESPVLEPLELFTEKSGEEIVRQLFNFEDKGGRQVSLRPEMTPSLARMVGARANGMAKPIRWFAIGENYRYEKPQKGRLRAFYQLNADLLGEAGPAADAELIALCADCLLGFGLTQQDFRVRISDRTLWFRYLASVGVPEANATAVLGVVDKLERGSPKDLVEAMTAALAGTACDPERTLAAARTFAATRSLEELAKLAAGDVAMTARLEEWNHLLGTLKSMGFGECIAIDLTIVRGLAYYTGFVFEAFETGGEARALAGGGRYDALVKKLGGPDLPAVGFGMGDVTLRDLLEAKKLIPAYADGPDFFVMVLGADARAAALEDVANLRRAGFRVEYNLRDGKFGKLAQQAETAGAKYALVYGGEEVAKGVTKVRSLTDRTEAEVPRTDLVPALRAVMEEGMRAILP